jgi:hypothetical protein
MACPTFQVAIKSFCDELNYSSRKHPIFRPPLLFHLRRGEIQGRIK